MSVKSKKISTMSSSSYSISCSVGDAIFIAVGYQSNNGGMFSVTVTNATVISDSVVSPTVQTWGGIVGGLYQATNSTVIVNVSPSPISTSTLGRQYQIYYVIV